MLKKIELSNTEYRQYYYSIYLNKYIIKQEK